MAKQIIQARRAAIKELEKVPLPTAYDIKQVELAAYICKSPKEFAEFLGVEPQVFQLWCQKSKACYEAFQTWKLHTTYKVERSLAKKATGFTKTTRKQILTRAGQVVELVNEEYHAPDTAAAQFWLKNRAPKDWKDTSQVDVNVNANIRAWLVNAMGEGDQSELIDVTPTASRAALLEVGPEALVGIVEDDGGEPELEPAVAPALADLNAKWV